MSIIIICLSTSWDGHIALKSFILQYEEFVSPIPPRRWLAVVYITILQYNEGNWKKLENTQTYVANKRRCGAKVYITIDGQDIHVSYIVHRPGRERELSTDIFPVRER